MGLGFLPGLKRTAQSRQPQGGDPVVGAQPADGAARRRRGLPSGTGGGRTRQAQPTPTPGSGTRSGRPSARCLDDSGSGVRHRLRLHGRPRRPEGRQPTPSRFVKPRPCPYKPGFTVFPRRLQLLGRGRVYRAVVERRRPPEPGSLQPLSAVGGKAPAGPAQADGLSGRLGADAPGPRIGSSACQASPFPPGVEAGAVGVRAVLRRARPGKPGPSLLKANPIALSKPWSGAVRRGVRLGPGPPPRGGA
jgi:hypothetical protein